MKKKYNYHTRQALAKMTDTEAWEIINNLAELEFCSMFEKGMLGVSVLAVGSHADSQSRITVCTFQGNENLYHMAALGTETIHRLMGFRQYQGSLSKQANFQP